MRTLGDSTLMRLRRLLGTRVEDRLRTSRNPIVLRTRARLGNQRVDLGRVSVIVPIYNVERYLRECLESIRVQNYPDLEVLMIDDGSPDGSSEIAREFVRRDPRFKLIQQPNGGLGAARNTGVRAATGKYLTFVDSDDAIPHDAYRRMVESLDASGSDFVVGGVERWRGKVRRRDDWVNRVHGSDHAAIRLDDLPEVIMDVFAWNKVFRTDFFREQVSAFPERILYEDQEPTALAYTRCRAFDVLAATTYYWRVREDGSSITQNKLTERDLNDRIAVAGTVGEVYRSGASPEIVRRWLQKTAGLDFGHYYRLSHRGTEEYWQRLVGFTRFLFEQLSQEDWAGVPIKERVLAYLISTGDRDLTAHAVGAQAQYPNGVPTSFQGGRFQVDLARWGLENAGIPEFVSALSETDTPLRSAITAASWVEPGVLRLEGFAYIDKFPRPIADSDLRLFAVRPGLPDLPLSIERHEFDPQDMNLPRTSYAEHPAAGIAAVLDLREILPIDFSSRAHLRLELESEGVVRSGYWVPKSPETAPKLVPAVLQDGSLFTVSANRFDGVRLRRRRQKLLVSAVTISDRVFAFELAALANLGGVRVIARNRAAALASMTNIGDLRGGEPTRVEISLPPVARAWGRALEAAWEFEVDSSEGRLLLPYPRLTPAEQAQLETGLVSLRAGKKGRAELVDSPWSASVEAVSGDSVGVVFEGRFECGESALPKMVLARTDGALIEHDRLEISDGRYRASFVLEGAPKWGEPFMSMTRGTFGLCLMPQDENDVFRRSLLMRFDDRGLSGRRFRVRTPRGHAEFSDSGHDHSVLMRLQGPLTPRDWNNQTRQMRIERLRAEALSAPLLPRTLLCLSFSGSSVNDSPKPIAEAMVAAGLVDEVVWGATDLSFDPGTNGRVVPMHSLEFIEFLHRARFLVNSAHFPHYFRKREGQIYVQTWHGTPLKKIADDVPPTSLSDSYRDLMGREVGYWDLLLGQSPSAGELLAKAFRYSGPLLTAGYPRNDRLVDPEGIARLRESVRGRYGLRPGQPVVLYAPTWRDNARSGVGANGFEALDVSALLDELGNDARLLLRGHANTLGFSREVRDRRILDVSGVSDLTGLFAASDLLITDYSSIFFDYMVQGKPIVGYAPDLENYSENLRGMYFDYAEVFPGPIALDNRELLSLLRSGPLPVPDVAGRNPLLQEILDSEKGRAAAAVVRWLEAAAADHGRPGSAR